MSNGAWVRRVMSQAGQMGQGGKCVNVTCQVCQMGHGSDVS